MKRSGSLLFLFVAFVTILAVTKAQPVPPENSDPAVEARLVKLSQELRCLQCQNQTIADSPSGLAEDLRKEIREQIKAGKSDKEIIDFLTARYGEFILYRPRITPLTYLLWFGPFVLLLGGLLLLFHYIKQRRDLVPDQPLSADERRRAEELLATVPGKETT